MIEAHRSGASRGRMRSGVIMNEITRLPRSPRHHRSLRPRLAIDVGSVNTLILMHGRGVILDEPSAIAIDRKTRRPIALGRLADQLSGREPPGVEVVHPLRNGVVADLDATTMMLGAFMEAVLPRLTPLRCDAAVCVPTGASRYEREALLAALDHDGRRFRNTILVEEPIAAALGVGNTESDSMLVLDIGGGTTEIGVVLCGAPNRARPLQPNWRIVEALSVPVAGNAMDEAVVAVVRRELGLHIASREAEALKIATGLSRDDLSLLTVAGKDRATSSPCFRNLARESVASALEPPVGQIVLALAQLLAQLPPQVAGDSLETGLWLTGGGALLKGLAERVSAATGITASVAPDPRRCVVRGLGLAVGYAVDEPGLSVA